ncbi:oligosaccharide flippase family protein [Jeotgalibaca porci]|uniref:lipopolysaccharide biosynthesis protein n=1 Tax=Jeotgalibaca porci TaxID=1868793 RepID=UPI003F912620
MSLIKTLKESKLVQASFWYTIGNIFIKGINFITIPLFTNLMTVNEYGQINNFLAMATIMGIFVGLSLYGSINNANFDFKDNMKQYMSSILFLSTLALVGFFILGNVLYLFRDEYFSISQTGFVFLILQSYGTFLVNFLAAYFTIKVQYFRFLTLSFLSIIFNVSFSVLFMLTVYSENRYIGRVVGSTVGIGILGAAIYILVMAKGRELVNKKYWKYGLSITLPLIPHLLSQNILSTFDRTMIRNVVGDYEAGIYSYILNLGVVLSVLWGSMNSAWVPWFYNEMNEKNYEKIKKTSNIYTLFFAAITLMVMLVMVDVAKIMAPAEYRVGIPLIIPILLGFYFQFLYSLPVNSEFYLKKTNYIALGTVSSAVIKIILNYIFLPRFGYQSAAFTTMISYFFLFVFHYTLSKKLVGRTLFDTKVLMGVTLGLCLLGGAMYFLIDYVLIRYALVLILVGTLFIFRKKLKFKSR